MKEEKKMKLRSDNITIRDFEEDDIQFKVDIINNSLNNTFLHYDLPLEYEKTLQWFKNKNTNNRLDCTIEYNDKVCGFIGLLDIDKKNNKAEYYICVDYSYSGKGIGTESSKLLLKYAFDNLNINKIYLYTEENNKNAQHLFEKIGFHKEGLLKDDIKNNGEFVNRVYYGIWKEDIDE